MKGMKKHEPKYPSPLQEKTSARISFIALLADIDVVRRWFFGEDKAKPKDVGEAAFNKILEAAKKRPQQGSKK